MIKLKKHRIFFNSPTCKDSPIRQLNGLQHVNGMYIHFIFNRYTRQFTKCVLYKAFDPYLVHTNLHEQIFAATFLIIFKTNYVHVKDSYQTAKN